MCLQRLASEISLVAPRRPVFFASPHLTRAPRSTCHPKQDEFDPDDISQFMLLGDEDDDSTDLDATSSKALNYSNDGDEHSSQLGMNTWAGNVQMPQHLLNMPPSAYQGNFPIPPPAATSDVPLEQHQGQPSQHQDKSSIASSFDPSMFTQPSRFNPPTPPPMLLLGGQGGQGGMPLSSMNFVGASALTNRIHRGVMPGTDSSNAGAALGMEHFTPTGPGGVGMFASNFDHQAFGAMPNNYPPMYMAKNLEPMPQQGSPRIPDEAAMARMSTTAATAASAAATTTTTSTTTAKTTTKTTKTTMKTSAAAAAAAAGAAAADAGAATADATSTKQKRARKSSTKSKDSSSTSKKMKQALALSSQVSAKNASVTGDGGKDDVKLEKDKGSSSDPNVNLLAPADQAVMDSKSKVVTSDSDNATNALGDSGAEFTDNPENAAMAKARANRDRNREHARNTRLRKKLFLENLKHKVEELNKEKEQAAIVLQKKQQILKKDKGSQLHVLGRVLGLWVSGITDRKEWEKWIDEDAVWSLPITPYRCFPPEQVMDNRRYNIGIDMMMADAQSQRLMFDGLANRTKFPFERVKAEIQLKGDMVQSIQNEVLMCSWVLKSVNAKAAGALSEVKKVGMLQCTFCKSDKSPLQKCVKTLHLMWDVMATMFELRQATGERNGNNQFNIVPNSVIMSRSDDMADHEARAIFASAAPHEILEVNKKWCELFGFTQKEVVGKLKIGDFLTYYTGPSAEPPPLPGVASKNKDSQGADHEQSATSSSSITGETDSKIAASMAPAAVPAVPAIGIGKGIKHSVIPSKADEISCALRNLWPAEALLVNKRKSGQAFANHTKIYPIAMGQSEGDKNKGKMAILAVMKEIVIEDYSVMS